MLTRNGNNDTKTMLIIELFANNGVWKYMYYMCIRKEMCEI